jgi:DNA mismatch repair protein MSH3
MAIASAVLTHLITTVRCSTLFITHYPLVASSLATLYPDLVQNLHMGYTEETRIDGTRQVTFLYKLQEGLAEESFGVECAQLAGLDERILERAAEMGRKMEGIVDERRNRNRYVHTFSFRMS